MKLNCTFARWLQHFCCCVSSIFSFCGYDLSFCSHVILFAIVLCDLLLYFTFLQCVFILWLWLRLQGHQSYTILTCKEKFSFFVCVKAAVWLVFQPVGTRFTNTVLIPFNLISTTNSCVTISVVLCTSTEKAPRYLSIQKVLCYI